MTDIYEITITTQDGEEYAGKMTLRQPELVNGFVALAQESGFTSPRATLSASGSRL